MNRLRIAAALLILLVLAVLGVRLLPLYLENMRLQSYVEAITQNAENRTRPDDALRVAVLEKAAFVVPEPISVVPDPPLLVEELDHEVRLHLRTAFCGRLKLDPWIIAAPRVLLENVFGPRQSIPTARDLLLASGPVLRVVCGSETSSPAPCGFV